MTRAEQLKQYVTDLEDYVAQHGHLPAASRSVPAMNKQRLQQALESPRTTEDIKQRIRTLLEARTYAGRTSPAADDWVARKPDMPRVLRYLDSLDAYLKVHGHLPASSSTQTPWTDKQRLNRYLKHPAIDDDVKRRVRHLLAQPGPARVTEAAAQEDFDALPAAVASLAKPLSAPQKEIVDWIIANRRTPRYRSSDEAEQSHYRSLATARRSALRGSATLRTLDFVLLIPGLLTAAELTQISSQAAMKRSQAAERESQRTRLGGLEERWNKGFGELFAWVADNGALPRRRTFDADEYRVANWLNVQRMQLRDNNLRLEWKERLATIPGALEPKAQLRGEAELAKTVADFYERHGRLPRADAPAPEGKVGRRLQKLRSRMSNRTIGRDALKVLSGIPGITEVQEQRPPLQRLADLAEFVQKTGAFPAKNSGGLSNWAYRALRGQGSKRAPEAQELRRAVRDLRNSIPYQAQRRGRREYRPLDDYLDALELHISAHGHLPSITAGAELRFRPDRLRGRLASASDDALRERILKVLAAPACPDGRRTAV